MTADQGAQQRQEYLRFLESKRTRHKASGFKPKSLNEWLYPFQEHVVNWNCEMGRSADFEDCGLGKTLQQLAWSDAVHRHTNKPILLLAPLAVIRQTKREGDRFGIETKIVRSQEECVNGINVTNYDMLHKFDPSWFTGIVLDESSILKNYTGATRIRITEAFASTPYRLACTATPAPNDHLELGNHAQFLSVMDSNEMISRWFINDTMKAGGYRLKGHAVEDYWNWMSSWAVSITKPSDIGFEDGAFKLPPLHFHMETVEVDITKNAGDKLYRQADLSATSLHKEMRITAPDRAARVAELVNANPNVPWLIWVNTDYEADAVMAMAQSAPGFNPVEVRGSMKSEMKEERLAGFADGDFLHLVTKADIAGFGMNYQHCRHQAHCGVGYSYEKIYQGVRRSWRYGQIEPVHIHMVVAETEGPILESIQRKQRQHEDMQRAMATAMALHAPGRNNELADYNATQTVKLPDWMVTK
jgi:hypothetical protein